MATPEVADSSDQNENSREESEKWTKSQIFTLISAASMNFSSMVCYSILGPFFPKEAEKKGVNASTVGMIFGCFSVFNLIFSLIMGKYGSLEIFSGLGLTLGPPIGGYLYQLFGYQIPFVLLGCLVLLMIPLNMCILPRCDGVASTGSFWQLVLIPKVTLMCLMIFSISSCISFLDPTISLFLIEKFKLKPGSVGLVFLGHALAYALSSPLLGLLSDKIPRIRIWLMLVGSWLIALSFLLLGPAPFLHIKGQLWLFISMLVVTGISLSLCGIPLFPEVINCVYERGFEKGLGTLGIVSGLFGAFWCLGSFVGPTLGGFLYDKLNFEWAATVQGGIPFVFGTLLGVYYMVEIAHKRSHSGNSLEEERKPLITN